MKQKQLLFIDCVVIRLRSSIECFLKEIKMKRNRRMLNQLQCSSPLHNVRGGTQTVQKKLKVTSITFSFVDSYYS